MNQTEIDELRRLASVSREPRHGIGCIASDCALASAARNAIPRLLAALEEARDERDRARQKIQAMEEQAMADEDGMSMRPLDGRLRKVEAERDRMRDVLLRNNFAPCDTQACNCGGWHERATGDGFYARFREIDEAIGDHNGKTLLAAVVEMVQERDALKAKLAKLAESERAWCELATERGAKLAALVEAMEHIKDIMGGHDGCQGFSSPEDVWGIADKALAAAKVQP